MHFHTDPPPGCTLLKCTGVFTHHKDDFLKVSTVSFGRLGLIKRLTVQRHGVFKGDLSVPALTPRG